MTATNSDVATLWLRLGQLPTQSVTWFDLARSYAACGLLWQAGHAARQALRLDETFRPRLQALDIGQWQDAAAGDSLLGRMALPNINILVEKFTAQVYDCPGDWLTWLYLARLDEMLNPLGPISDSRQPEYVQLPSTHARKQAETLEPIVGESLHWLGVWRLNAGDAAGSVAALSGLLDIRPIRFGSMMYLGEALLRIGNVAAAEKAFSRASQSNNPEFLRTLSVRVYSYNYWQEAIAVLQRALTIQPGNVPNLLTLANIQSEVYMLSECRDSLRKAIEVEPNNLEARLLDAGLLGRMGDAEGHLAALMAAYESDGNPLSRLASSIAMTSLYNDSLMPTEVTEIHRRLCAPIEASLIPKTEFSNTRSPRRRLRVGFVTGDIHRQHPVNIFILPVLMHINHAQFDVCVYHTGTMHDEYTARAQGCTNRWLEAATLDDASLQQAIVADEVDILIDLAGHTSSHRLGIFARRAAPVQVTFLGYPHSTGLSTIDWLIGDATVSPAEHFHLFSEGLAQLPNSVFCWAPVDDYPLPSPRPTTTPLVFGSFNNAMKLSPKTIALWAKVLQIVPDSQLLLKAPSLRDDGVRGRFAALFSEQGIDRERLILRGPSGLVDMMQEYGDIDIALDPTPYNGGTTTLQALWMGVPVVALCGETFAGRMGASFLKTLGKSDWVSTDEAGYVEAAVGLARNVCTLRSNRGALREQMAASPLCNITVYVRHLEALFRRMWEAHCASETQRLIRVEAEIEGVI